MAVNIIEGDIPVIEQKTVSRYDRNAQTQEFSDEVLNDSKISRVIYAKLSNIEDMKNISDGSFLQEDIVPEKSEERAIYVQDRHNEFSEFMMQLSDLYSTGENKNNILKIDEYFGSLGIYNEYPFIDDTYSGKIIDIEEQNPTRNVIYIDDNNIKYNVIANINGTLYNVIHSTIQQRNRNG